MSEWAKTLLSATAGMLAGLLADPLRTALQQGLAKRRVSRILVDELLTLSGGLMFAMRLRTPKLSLRTERFDYLYDKERATLYLLKGYPFLLEIFQTIKSFQGASLPARYSEEEYILLGAFEALSARVEMKELGRYFRRQLLRGKDGRFRKAVDLYCEFPEVDHTSPHPAPN